MSDPISDILNLSQAVSGFAQSAVQLHGARVQAEIDRDAVKITNTQTAFLQRFNLPIGDPQRLDSRNWREALADYQSEVDGMIESIPDEGVRQSVGAHFAGSESQFRLGLSNSLAAAEFTETRALAMDTVGEILTGGGSVADRFMLADSYLKKRVADGTFLESEYNDTYEKLLLPYETEANKQFLYGEYSEVGGLLDAESETYARNAVDYALTKVAESSTYTSGQKARISESIMADQLATDTQIQKQFDTVFAEAVERGQTPSPEELQNFFASYGTQVSLLKLSELQIKAEEVLGAQLVGDIDQYIIRATAIAGRGISGPVATQYKAGLDKQLKDSIEAIVAKFPGDDQESEAERLRLQRQVEEAHKKGMDTIDSWKRSEAEDIARTKSWVESDWRLWWEAFKDPSDPQGGKPSTFFDARDKLNGYLKMYPTADLGNQVGTWMREVDKYYADAMGEADMVGTLRLMLASADGEATFGTDMAGRINNLLGNKTDISKWSETDAGIGLFIEDVYKDYQIRIQSIGSADADGKKRVLKQILTQYAGLQKYAGRPIVDKGGRRWDLDAAPLWQELTKGFATGVDAADSVSIGEAYRQVEEAVMTNLIIPGVASGKIFAPGQDPTKLIPIRMGNDLYFTNSAGGLYAVDTIDGKMVIRKSPAGLTFDQRDHPDTIKPGDLERDDWELVTIGEKPVATTVKPDLLKIKTAASTATMTATGGATYPYPTAEVLAIKTSRMPTAIDTPAKWAALSLSEQKKYLRLFGVFD